ncbi:hypothetical protein BKA57DRAFT_172555 [Linnemannia elongata]|nr:hypothetical protein BKA57DRAFT_172555 [Linnemannia elongata]
MQRKKCLWVYPSSALGVALSSFSSLLSCLNLCMFLSLSLSLSLSVSHSILFASAVMLFGANEKG